MNELEKAKAKIQQKANEHFHIDNPKKYGNATIVPISIVENVLAGLEKTHVCVEKKQLQELCQDCRFGLKWANPTPMKCEQAFCEKLHPRRFLD